MSLSEIEEQLNTIIGQTLYLEMINTPEKEEMCVALNQGVLNGLDNATNDVFGCIMAQTVSYVSTRCFVLCKLDARKLAYKWNAFLNDYENLSQNTFDDPLQKYIINLTIMHWKAKAAALIGLCKFGNLFIVDDKDDIEQSMHIAQRIIDRLSDAIINTTNIITISYIIHYLSKYTVMISYPAGYYEIDAKIAPYSACSLAFDVSEDVGLTDSNIQFRSMCILTKEIYEKFSKHNELNLVYDDVVNDDGTKRSVEVQYESLPTEQELASYTTMGTSMRNATVKIIIGAMRDCCSKNKMLITGNIPQGSVIFDYKTESFIDIPERIHPDEVIDFDKDYWRELKYNALRFKNSSDQETCEKEVTEILEKNFNNSFDRPNDPYRMWMRRTLDEMLTMFEDVVSKYM